MLEFKNARIASRAFMWPGRVMVNSSPFQGEDYGFDPRPGYQFPQKKTIQTPFKNLQVACGTRRVHWYLGEAFRIKYFCRRKAARLHSTAVSCMFPIGPRREKRAMLRSDAAIEGGSECPRRYV